MPTAVDTTLKWHLTSRGWPADREVVTAAVHSDQLATQRQAPVEESWKPGFFDVAQLA